MKYYLVLFFFFLFSLPSLGANWVGTPKLYIDKDSFETYYKNGNKYVSVWIKMLNKGQFEPINNKRIWYTISKAHVDCSNKKIGFTSTAYYGLDRYVLYSDDTQYPDFYDIPPESLGEVVWFSCEAWAK